MLNGWEGGGQDQTPKVRSPLDPIGGHWPLALIGGHWRLFGGGGGGAIDDSLFIQQRIFYYISLAAIGGYLWPLVPGSPNQKLLPGHV